MAGTPSHIDLSRRIDAALHDRQAMAAGLALHRGRLGDAERLLKTRLRADPFDVVAIRMLAEVAARIGRVDDAATLLRRALELAPGFGAARVNLASLLFQTNRPAEALDTLAALDTDDDAENPGLRAAVLGRLGQFEAADAIYRAALAAQPDAARLWMSHGHVLKTLGKVDEAVAAYSRAVALRAGFGEAWWSLANLKTVRFEPAQIAAMREALDSRDLTAEDAFHLEFALARAMEDQGDWAAAFAGYTRANAARRALIAYDADVIHTRAARAAQVFTAEFFAQRQGWGCDAGAPIFIVGLPRSGSTLIEQILASHSQVEAITELPDIPDLWAGLGDDPIGAVSGLSADDARALGEAYLARVAPQRQSAAPIFIDKLPNNWIHAGFIRLILPRARIVDARRHPLSCGVSNFRQHYARGQHFSYDLGDIGRYYADYVALMAHFDAHLPGGVIRVIHQDMVADSEGVIRALLDRLDLDFEPACLEFHRNDRAVRTPSAQQVRVPIFRDGVDNWQVYDAWLGPLRDALGPVLADWRGGARAPA